MGIEVRTLTRKILKLLVDECYPDIEAVCQADGRDEYVAACISECCAELRTRQSNVRSDYFYGASDWSDYEHDIWALGEAVRQLIVGDKKWRNSAALVDTVIEVATNKAYGKGRQSFVMLLGSFRHKRIGPTLCALLNDNEVVGHAVSALRKARLETYVQQVKPIASHTETWIRNEAKKYVERFSK